MFISSYDLHKYVSTHGSVQFNFVLDLFTVLISSACNYFQYVLNVTPDLPNVFEDRGSFKYMQIPIMDHWSQNLAIHFPKAIEFIGT